MCRCFVLVLALAAGFVLPSCSRAQDKPVPVDPVPTVAAAPEFARFAEIGDDEGRYETAITTYERDGTRVSLIAAVHLADAGHYKELQAEFTKYDAVLYELVASAKDRPKPGQKRGGGSPIGMLQIMLKRGLELEFQLHAIDYTPANFVHADLTPAGFAAKMEERGESFMTIFLKMMSQQMEHARKKQEQEEAKRERGENVPVVSFDLVTAFQRGEGRHLMRMMFAQQLGQVEALASGGGPGTTLLEGRNERAIEVLQEQLEAGVQNLAIYYGAAHMTGIEKSLVAMGFRKAKQRWLTAWDIRKRPDPKRGANKH